MTVSRQCKNVVEVSSLHSIYSGQRLTIVDHCADRPSVVFDQSDLTTTRISENPLRANLYPIDVFIAERPGLPPCMSSFPWVNPAVISMQRT